MQNWALELQDIPEGSRTLSTTMILRIFTEKFTHWGWWLLDMDLSVCSSSHALICRKFSEPWSRLAYQHTISCCCSVSRSCLTLCDLVDCSTLGFPVLRYLLEFAQTHVHWVTDAIQPSYPLCPLLLRPSIFPRISIFSNESVLHITWPKYWSFSFSIHPSIEHSGSVSFNIDWFDLPMKGTQEVRVFSWIKYLCSALIFHWIKNYICKIVFFQHTTLLNLIYLDKLLFSFILSSTALISSK